MTTPNILTFSGSTRSGSLNAKLLDYVDRQLEEAGLGVTRISLSDYAMPIYNGDLEEEDGPPPAARELHRLFRSHGGIVIASPEYNANVTPLIANTLAWLSRVQDNGGIPAAFGKPVFGLVSASPGGFGGYRGLMALRTMLVLQLSARVLPQMASVPGGLDAFDDDGALKPDFPKKMVGAIAASFTDILA